MKLDAWTTQGSTADAARRKRLTIGYGVGAGFIALALSVITVSAHGRVFEEDDTIDVSLASAPVVSPMPEPEVAPTPPPPPVVKSKARQRKTTASLSPTPNQIPNSVPDEAEPGRTGTNEGDLDSLFEEGSGSSAAQTKVAQARQKPVEKPQSSAPPAPLLESEQSRATHPLALNQPAPQYPEDARKQGVEGLVVVRFIVGPNGEVLRVKVVKGHPLLNPAVVATVRSWRFRAGTYEGQPVAMWKSARFPFRLTS